MLYLYFSNDLNCHKDKLLSILRQPLGGVFQSERILVQSQGMAQWLKLNIAQAQGISANVSFPLPASFIWNQYHRALDNIPEHNAFTRDAMLWHIMALLPDLLGKPEFAQLKHYLEQDDNDQKRFQLCNTLAGLFDQYLVYRMDWIEAWESGHEDVVFEQLHQGLRAQGIENASLLAEIRRAVQAQGTLWRTLFKRIQQGNNGNAWHRAALHKQYLIQLQQGKVRYFPPRLFVFGIAALPESFWQMLQAIAEHCDVHVFYNNPCQHFWGDIIDEAHFSRIQLRETRNMEAKSAVQYFDIGNPLLASWGKMGRDFFNLLSEHPNSDDLGYLEHSKTTLLGQIQNAILHLEQTPKFTVGDDSVIINSCHSPMREVEVLQQQLLRYFEQDSSLTPKDIVVMLPDVEQYVPYIHAVFSRYEKEDERYIPYAIADRTLSHSDHIVATFLNILRLNDSQFSAEQVLALLDVSAVRERFGISENELAQLRQWVIAVDIRYGLDDQSNQGVEKNWNAWQSGLNRMLLGSTMRPEDGAWLDIMPFGLSYGLHAQLCGKLGEFLDTLSQWLARLNERYSLAQWQAQLMALLDDFFVQNAQTQPTLHWIYKQLDEVFAQIQHSHCQQAISATVMADYLQEKLDERDLAFNFLTGKLNFCTLLPMRAIPFKVVALLGMNEGQYPRVSTPTSFDLMQYATRAGDRVRRDDDRYLFLEALLSAQQHMYLSYVGRSMIKHELRQPSVLISQLIDYIVECADDDRVSAESLICEQPMTAFSMRNFQGEKRSYAKEWLLTGEVQLRDFIQPLPNCIEQENQRVSLDQLIKFITDPVTFFFEQQLGVYWADRSQQFLDSENFTLDSLGQFHVSDTLLEHPYNEWQSAVEHIRLQGKLPRAHFAQLVAQEQMAKTEPLAQQIAPYLPQTPSQHVFTLDSDGWQLDGVVGHLYAQQYVNWRAGKLRSKDYITVWLHHLALCTQSAVSQPSCFWAINDKLEFALLEPTQAKHQLQVYLHAYQQALKQIIPMPSEALVSHFMTVKNLPETPEEIEDVMTKVLTQQGENRYWARLFSQQCITVDEKTALYTLAQNWFALLVASQR
ncbi:exodeoxyribonuclease V subunit gamma [Spirabiliibacterium falconis]|uniref:exodeoxyribonuclease V subunit gamma n=1 Tax=Spirabiliibacterium falconis TaxID=572023 RepID=UPI001AADAC1B|nr:exodeoxyribonuclease V subunit gamma [Spirabiliibacterium falconis]MBE2893842.1 exodeoxyribonuclease V subunit gamma [Spirabiliibacterium falconis]